MTDTSEKQREASRYERQGVEFYTTGEYTKAKDYHEKALAIRKETRCRQGQASSYVNLGAVFRALGELVKAKECQEEALAISKEIGFKEGEGFSYGNLGAVYHSLEDYGKAIEYHEKALAISKQLGDKEEEAKDYGNLGTVYFSLGEHAKAIEYLKKEFTCRKEIDDRKGDGAPYGGALFQALEEYGTTKENLNEAHTNAKVICSTKGKITGYRIRAAGFLSLREYDEAKENLQLAIDLAEQIGDREGESSCYEYLGNLFCSLGVYCQAKGCHEKALAIRKEIGNRKGEGSSYGNLGTVSYFLGCRDNAKDQFEKALVIRKETGDRRGEATDYENLGALYDSIGELGKSKEYLEEALVISKEIGDRETEATVSGKLGTVCFSLAEHGTAKEYHEKALAIRKEIGDREGEAEDYANLGNVFCSFGEYGKAKEYQEKALAIRKEIGDRDGEATSYGNLGNLLCSLGDYNKAKEYHEKALAIKTEFGGRKGESTCYGNLATLFLSLGEYGKAKELLEMAVAIGKEIGDRKGEAASYGNLGSVFLSFGEYEKAKAQFGAALAISKEIGDRKGEGSVYGNLGAVFECQREYGKAKEHLEKALLISKEIGDRKGEAANYGNIGTVFKSLGEYGKAKEYHNKAFAISKEIGHVEAELTSRVSVTQDLLSERNTEEAFSHLSACIGRCEDVRGLLRDDDEFKISFSHKYYSSFEALSVMLCAKKNPFEAGYVEELVRARALADLMSAQYGVTNQISVDPLSWNDIERIIENENSCTCLYISYFYHYIFLWVINPRKPKVFRRINVNDSLDTKGSIKTLDKFLGKDIIFRKFHISPEGHCEDRSLFPVNDSQPIQQSSKEDSPAAFRIVEEDEEGDFEPEPSLSLYYKLIIAPVAYLLEEPEIIIVPDRSLYNVPFAALRAECGSYLSETFRIRMVPSLTTLKLIQDSPANYHSQTGALIVGDPEVGHVMYKGRPERKVSLPFARKEAEMIGRLFGAPPLLGKLATKQAVLERINSVSLIHFAAHGNAERGEIALAPSTSIDGIPREKDYLLTMSDISKVQLRAKLVVLSCCHSASGQVRAEGVVGIARAFLGSGARSVLVALWALEDSATEQLMSRFYEHLAHGESASESLHQAMKWMRGNGYSDVRDWAPFMLIGDDVNFDLKKLKVSFSINYLNQNISSKCLMKVRWIFLWIC